VPPPHPPQDEEDPYFKAVLDYRYGRHNLRFKVSQDLFSSARVDQGTGLLLKSLRPVSLPAAARLLDMGCGYGALGLSLAAWWDPAEVVAIDRDYLALRYCRQNAELNHLSGVSVAAGLSYDGLPAAGFDLIVSNVPGKAPTAVLRHLLLGGSACLRPGGFQAVVAITPIASEVDAILSAGAEVIHRAEYRNYLVVHFRPGGAGAGGRADAHDALAAYRRGRMAVDRFGVKFEIPSYFDLPEFDTLSFQTELVMEHLAHLQQVERLGRVLITNPGQGALPRFACSLGAIGPLELLDRDLLALEASRAAVLDGGLDGGRLAVRHGLATEAAAPDGEAFDLVVVPLRRREPQNVAHAAVSRLTRSLRPGGAMVVGGASSAVSRLVEGEAGRSLGDVALTRRSRKHGYSAATLSRRT